MKKYGRIKKEIMKEGRKVRRKGDIRKYIWKEGRKEEQREKRYDKLKPIGIKGSKGIRKKRSKEVKT